MALSETELSYAYPLLGAGYALVAILSCAFFKETFSVVRMAGVGIVVIGIILMSRS